MLAACRHVSKADIWPHALLDDGRPRASPIPFTHQRNVLTWDLRDLLVTTMRSRVRKTAHVLERIGLAMAGAASGLFVAAHVGSSIAVFASEGFIIMMMIGGAVGFYLGIDIPALAFHPPYGRPSKGGSSGKVDSAEFLSALGTFLATLTAFVSVITIVLREDPHIYWTMMIMLGWVVGVLMQIIAGAIARARA
jgi:hypothetical protein